jgi:hypothetical protein
MNRIVVSLVLSVLLLASCQTIAADDCCGPCIDSFSMHYSKPEEMSRLADHTQFLFVGTIVKAELVPCCDRFADLTFRIRKVWKGPALTSATVRAGAGCARLYPFVIGREYLVAATDATGVGARLLPDISFSPLEASKATEQMVALDSWQRAKSDQGPTK